VLSDDRVLVLKIPGRSEKVNKETYCFLESGNDVTLDSFVALVPERTRVDEVFKNIGGGAVVEECNRGLLFGVVLDSFDTWRAWKRLVMQ
jgi:hypothetical protein